MSPACVVSFLVLNATTGRSGYYPCPCGPGRTPSGGVPRSRSLSLSIYERHHAKSARFEMFLPSVVVRSGICKPPRHPHPSFTRFTFFLSRPLLVQYCCSAGGGFYFRPLIPRSKGGAPPGTPFVASLARATSIKPTCLPREIRCSRCKPRSSRRHYLHNNGRAFPPNHLHQEALLDYLYWYIELEPERLCSLLLNTIMAFPTAEVNSHGITPISVKSSKPSSTTSSRTAATTSKEVLREARLVQDREAALG